MKLWLGIFVFLVSSQVLCGQEAPTDMTYPILGVEIEGLGGSTGLGTGLILKPSPGWSLGLGVASLLVIRDVHVSFKYSFATGSLRPFAAIGIGYFVASGLPGFGTGGRGLFFDARYGADYHITDKSYIGLDGGLWYSPSFALDLGTLSIPAIAPWGGVHLGFLF